MKLILGFYNFNFIILLKMVDYVFDQIRLISVQIYNRENSDFQHHYSNTGSCIVLYGTCDSWVVFCIFLGYNKSVIFYTKNIIIM